MCDKAVSSKSNLLRHVKLMHSETKKKYLKHIKKNGKFTCKICGKEYTHSSNLKFHYGHHHTKKDIAENNIPKDPLIYFSKKRAMQIEES